MRLLNVAPLTPAPLLAFLSTAVMTAGCGGVQSSLAPAGREAERIAALFWWMCGGALVIWIAVIVLALYCIRARPEGVSTRQTALLIVGGGVVVPTVVLAVLLGYGLAMMPPLVARSPEGTLLVEVIGEQWWWRVRYLRADGAPIELANEIRLPVGERVQFRLASDNVIHSFWIPSLAGKMDMIPGRETYLALQPTATGVFRGACAEYCGASHALMAFYVEVMERDAFDRWLAGQAAPAGAVSAPAAARGEALFVANGCSACHTVKGTSAAGVIGPDLTHVGSRLSLAAGILPNDSGALLEWLSETERLKPGAHMPRFGMLPQEDLRALAAYLEGLK
jgi:cytochrome c oxidase subunit 2